jgi:hypothetical protein
MQNIRVLWQVKFINPETEEEETQYVIDQPGVDTNQAHRPLVTIRKARGWEGRKVEHIQTTTVAKLRHIGTVDGVEVHSQLS